jgi:Fe-S-cluster containining protein
MVDLLVAHGLINEGEKSLTVKFAHRCQHLDAKNNCMIYEARPQICRDYLCGKARGDAKRPPDLPHF